MTGRFPRVLHCMTAAHIKSLITILLSIHLLESFYRSSTEERIHMTSLSISFVFISWSAWTPVSRFPSHPEEQDVTNSDATSLTAVHCNRVSPGKQSNH